MNTQTLDITLEKRGGKAVLYTAVLVILIIGLVQFIAHIISGTREWYLLVIAAILTLVVIFMARDIIQYFMSKEMRLIVEAEGTSLTFHNVDDQGKISNKTAAIDSSKMTRFYVVKTRTRYMIENYSFAFEGPGWTSTENVKAFPALYEANEEGRNKVLAFVKMTNPDIDLGYENLWQKITK